MAKPAENPKPKSKKRRARQILKARRAKRNPDGGGARANPPILTDFTHVILPGFGAYAATRFIQRIAYTVSAKRWPRLAKHIHAASGVAAAAGAWFFAHKVKSAAKYHDGIVLGSGIAALQGVAQAYLPKYAWMTADVTGAGAPATLAQQKMAQAQIAAGGDAGDEFAYLDEEARTVKAPRRGSPFATTMQMAAAAAGDQPTTQVDTDILDELEDGEDIDDLGGGIFDGGSLSN